MDTIQLAVLDIDGVIYCQGGVAPKSREAIEVMENLGLAIRYLTNDAVTSRKGRADELNALGLEISPEDVFTACSLTADYLRQHGNPRTLLLTSDACRDEFDGIPQDKVDPEAVVVGDTFGQFDYEDLNAAFRALRRGARFLATQRNRFSSTGSGPNIDVGFLVAGLEYCSDRSAVVMGKPATTSYISVCRAVNVSPNRAVMVSDDLSSDLRGASDAGLFTVHLTDFSISGTQNELNAADYVANNLWEFACALQRQRHKNAFL